MTALRQVLAIAAADLRRVLRRKDTLLWLVLMPLPYTYFFGVAFQESPEEAIPVTLVAPRPDGGAAAMRDALERAGFAVRTVDRWDGEREIPKSGYRVDLPPALGRAVLDGERPPLAVWTRPNDPEATHLEVVLREALLELAARGLARLRDGGPVTPEDLARPLQAVPVEVEVRDWGERRQVPSGFKQAVPGNMVMFVLMSVLVTGAVRLLMDREAGHLARMLARPVLPRTVVVSQLLSLSLLGAAESVYFLVLARVVFRQPLGPHPLALAGVLLAFAVAGAGGGVLLGSLLRTPRQAAAAGIFTTLLLAALGGCWWPVEILPPWLRTVAMVLPTGQAMQGVVKLLVWQRPPSAVLPQLVYLAATAAVACSAAAWVLARMIRE